MNTSIRRPRRAAAAAVLGTALTLVLAGCGGDDTTSAEPSALDPDADLTEQTIVVSNWEAYMPDDIAEVVKERTGATVEVTSHATNEDMVAKVTGSGGEGLDVVFGSQPYLEALAKAGMLEPLDTDFLDNWGNLDPAAVDTAEVDGAAYWAPYTWGTTGICYRSDLVDAAPTSWYDLLEPSEANKGKVTMMGTERWAMLPALKALGYSVNTTDEGELNEAKDLMVAAKPDLLAYDDTTFYERLISGEATMVQAWDGWCNYGIAEDDRIEFVVPEEGSDLWSDGIAVLKSSENKEAAYAFIDTILDAKTHAWVEENILYNIPNEAALAEVPAELTETYDLLGSRREEMLSGENMTDVGDDAAAIYNQIITEVTAS
ncbi:spermidine/putrescine ABC transporter substrate-binding protein [Nocardioides psychrotolerans]|uniref:Spermidine/putrescine transport system substrate-binding protein n=1 Tax=Nocardioides psychrotolerans TaxID=1005945 RepID=A0A1I3PAJ6_9ACTN|nr:spermidine/putrescine ABC transporter substrate-binding protein [Nocardioides psychrotolerans]GEP39630.1 spermidine/putrescine ABC transporter substrate-binding protein [Nocardioides psychrotolerans]SFJ18568.1 spermidine/putrescine transport system substrate-binding protein [Nocardioides psychrotolerans]